MDGRDLLYSYEICADCVASAATLYNQAKPSNLACTKDGVLLPPLLLRSPKAAGAQLQHHSQTTLTGWCTRPCSCCCSPFQGAPP